jgi:glycosyltransferase involved in cell wall biosynthesis
MTKKKSVLHFATWFPKYDGDIDGIFIKRHIEVLSLSNEFQHAVIAKSHWKMGVLGLLRCILGKFPVMRVGNLDVNYFPNDESFNIRFFHRYKEQIWKVIICSLYKKFKPAICHLHVTYGFAQEVVYMKSALVVPFIISEHCAPFPFNWIQNKELVIDRPIRKADKIVAVSNAQAKQIKQYLITEVEVIPNVVNKSEFFYRGPLQGVGINIVFVGIYDKRKGLDYLLNALPIILNEFPEIVVHLVGSASKERMAEIHQQIADFNIEKKAIVFHEVLTPIQLNALFNNCDFFVCTSEYESFGVAVLESLFAGLPVMSTDCGGVRDFLNESNSILIPNDNSISTLVEGFRKMLQILPQFNRHLISEEVNVKFSKNSIKQKYENLYSDILNKNLKMK